MAKQPRPVSEKSPASSFKKRALWTVLFVLIAVLTVWAFTAQNKDFSLSSFVSFLSALHPGWLCAALLAMLLYIFFEGAAIWVILRALGHRRGVGKNFSYAAADVYFSAITPSATGGQPASAFFMYKDGIPFSVVTVSLLLNLILYAFAIVLLGIFCFILKPSALSYFTLTGKILILVGIAVQLVLAIGFILLLRYPAILHRAGNGILTFLEKIRLLRRVEQKKAKLDAVIASYQACASSVGKKRGAISLALFFNVLQRACFIAATVFTCFAALGGPHYFAELWASESMVVLGSNYIPVPGAMGVADSLLLDALKNLFDPTLATNLELFSRAISFYLCVFLCGGVTLYRSIRLSIRRRREEKEPESADTTENDLR